MTLSVGDRVVMIPLSGGGSVAVLSGEISVGDSVVLIPDRNGGRIAVKPTTPQVGDKVVVIPLSGGGKACLVVAGDDSGGSSTPVLPPANFQAIRDGPSTAALSWALNEGNDAVRIVRRSDRYPLTITDGACIYEGAATTLEDTGLDFRLSYYYCAWGREGSHYSNGYLMDYAPKYGINTDPILVVAAWRRFASSSSEIVTYGPYRYQWDGQGKVYISAAASTAQGIQIDDIITADGPRGTFESGKTGTADTWFDGKYRLAEITDILNAGENLITIRILNNPYYGGYIGTTTPLYIMRVL